MKVIWMILCLAICLPVAAADLCDDARDAFRDGRVAEQENFVESLRAEGEARAAENAWRQARLVEDAAMARMIQVFGNPESTVLQQRDALDAARAATLQRLVAESEMQRCHLRVLQLKLEMAQIRSVIAAAQAYLVGHCGGI